MVQRQADAERRHDGERHAARDELALQAAGAFRCMGFIVGRVGSHGIFKISGNRELGGYIGTGPVVGGIHEQGFLGIGVDVFRVDGVYVLGIHIGIHVSFLSSLDIG